MLFIRALPSRTAARSLCATCLRTHNPTTSRALSLLSSSRTPNRERILRHRVTSASSAPSSLRSLATKSSADTLIEDIQDQYATARDEFEIATEETEKKTVYAADDRAAAREELNKLKEMFEKAVEGEDGEDVRKRVGHRIRELDNAVQGLEQSALEH